MTEGKLADLILLDANPLENIEHTKDIAAVVLSGRHLSRMALDTLLERAAAIVRRQQASVLAPSRTDPGPIPGSDSTAEVRQHRRTLRCSLRDIRGNTFSLRSRATTL